MISRLMTVFGILVLGFAAQAQSANCVKSMSLSPYSSAVNKFYYGSARCINDDNVSSSFSYSALPDASGAHAALNQKCQSIYGGCAPRLPTYSYSFTGQYLSASTSGNLVSVKFASTATNRYTCEKTTTNYLAVLDKSIPENALFFSRYPIANLKWMKISLKCNKTMVSQTTYDANGIPTYNKSYLECRVYSSYLTTAPYSPSCYQQYQL